MFYIKRVIISHHIYQQNSQPWLLLFFFIESALCVSTEAFSGSTLCCPLNCFSEPSLSFCFALDEKNLLHLHYLASCQHVAQTFFLCANWSYQFRNIDIIDMSFHGASLDNVDRQIYQRIYLDRYLPSIYHPSFHTRHTASFTLRAFQSDDLVNCFTFR